ncbi:hypothetical protein WS51_18360 [Burkholderia territorii]|nr:hypothetical protein WS51_18360 [Burkholderia territorii]
MTASLSDYAALITSEHRNQPRFSAVLGALVQPLVDQMNVLESMPGKFDLDDAVGVQLDDVGLWVGVSRKIRTPLTGIYFSFDVAGLGFDQGIWKGPFDPDTGLTVLDDDTYRLVIRAKIGANHWDGTLESSAAILNSIFGNPGNDLIQVHANGEVFGTGDGATKNFPMTYGGAQVRRVDSATLFRNDWQGNQKLYPTSRTNKFLQSGNLLSPSWAQQRVASLTTAVGPDGSSNAATLTANALGTAYLYQGFNDLVAGQRYELYAIAKPGTGNLIALTSFTQPGQCIFTLSGAGSAGVPTGIASNPKIFPIGGGWYWCSIEIVPTSSGFNNVSSTNVVTANSSVTFFAPQLGPLADGMSSPTSYIPTAAAPATVADYVLSSSGVAQLAVAPSRGAKLSWTGDGAVYRQGTRVFIEDHQDMSMTIGIAGKVPSAVFLALLAGGYIPLKPEGVRVNYTIVSSVDNEPLFGFDVNNQYIAGFDTGAWGVPA